jgi:molybdopterin-containing oxidoreductase family iron-sulfur binding subunit
MNDAHEKIDEDRRRLIGAAAGVATAVVAPGVFLHTVAAAQSSAEPANEAQRGPRTEPVTNEKRWGMLIDTSRCADGCSACVTACNQENGLNEQTKPPGQDEEAWQEQRSAWIRKVKLQDKVTGRITSLPLLCQHCEHPPCVDVCPTGASFKRADGLVLVDRHTCIGCRYCMMACPYKARSFIHSEVEHKLSMIPRGKGCVESCTLCVHRLDFGDYSTACADACAKDGNGAIVFGDLKDPDSALSQVLQAQPNRQIREDLRLNTGVRYAGI